MVGRICPPPGWDRVKVSENLGATAVAPVAPADTSLLTYHIFWVLGQIENTFCDSPIFKAASEILQNMDETVNPCDDFYQFACGNFIKKTAIPDDRTRVSSFSVLSDELLSQVCP